jgi:alkanesulfonate monooxygenase SsuD/methylene tetrahydromethanopterin reductase-like flavin-dependent oxidoreductase (luciferase family)
VAEEFAMIDVISGGRLIAGMVVGGGPEYYSFSVNPAHARERFQESHDLIVKAWTEPGPFEWVSKHYRIRYVNPWPRPLQQPHPEIWIPGAGSVETMEFVARHRYAYMGIPYFHIDVFKRYFSMFRDACEAEGYDADPQQYGWLLPIYVAETDEQARREYEEHLWYFVKRLLPGITIQPPGYTSARSLASILKSAGRFMLNLETWEQVVDGRYAIVGSPETVAGQLIDSLRELGAGNLLGLFQLGSLPDHLVRKNMALFAEQVIPKLRAEFPEGQPVYRPQAKVA